MTTYRHERFVGAAVEAALAQTWPALDIVISDDGSDDRTFECVAELAAQYRGPHRLVLSRQGSNRGASHNLMETMRLTEAPFLVLTHGDDISAPERVQRVAETWLATGASLIAHQATSGPEPTNARPIAPVELPSGPISLVELSRTSWTPRMLGASFSFERRIFTEFGPLDRARLPRGGDHVLPTRAALLGGFYYLAEQLMFWRRHAGQMTQTTADFGGSPASHVETWKAYDINALLYRLEEVRAFAGRHGSTAEIAEAERTLVATLMRSTREWSEARTVLEGAGHALEFVAPRRAPAMTEIKREVHA